MTPTLKCECHHRLHILFVQEQGMSLKILQVSFVIKRAWQDRGETIWTLPKSFADNSSELFHNSRHVVWSSPFNCMAIWGRKKLLQLPPIPPPCHSLLCLPSLGQAYRDLTQVETWELVKRPRNLEPWTKMAVLKPLLVQGVVTKIQKIQLLSGRLHIVCLK